MFALCGSLLLLLARGADDERVVVELAQSVEFRALESRMIINRM